MALHLGSITTITSLVSLQNYCLGHLKQTSGVSVYGIIPASKVASREMEQEMEPAILFEEMETKFGPDVLCSKASRNETST